jgi:serine/threonine-protein kinase
MRGAVAGIRAAHEKGVIHRDLKPENIMLVEQDGNRDFVKLLDFGIARLESGNLQSGMQPLTIAGTPLGTPAYMSPEQVLGKSVDARSDLYSLGVIFFELLTGSCPFDGNIARLLQQQLTAEPPELPPAVAAESPALARIVRMLLAKAPKNRFQTAGELAEALHAAAAGRAGQRARAVRIPPQSESRTLAALTMQASLARKRLVGMMVPRGSHRLGFRRRGVIAALCCATVLLVLVVFAATRDRSAPVAADAPGPSATVRAEPSHLDPRPQPSGKSSTRSPRTRGK